MDSTSSKSESDSSAHLEEYFPKEELEIMGQLERRRYENLIQNYYAMLAMGLEAQPPSFMLSKPKKREFRKEATGTRSREPPKTGSTEPRRVSNRDKKAVQRFKPPPLKLKIEDTNTDDDYEQLALIGNWSDDDIETRSSDFNWRSGSSSTSSEDDSYSFDGNKRKRKAKGGTSKGSKCASKLRNRCRVKTLTNKKKVLPKRKCVSMMNYKEIEDTDDSYIYCEECQLEYIDDCIIHPLSSIQDTEVPMGVKDRAKKTLPPGISLSSSKIRNAGLGVWTNVPIAKYSRFGPYQGIKRPFKDIENDDVSGYGWLIRIYNGESFYIDGEDIESSNWLRFVNCARTKREQNLEAYQYRGQIFYKTTKDIKIGTELLVWYGDDYATELGIDKEMYSSTLDLPVSTKVGYSCSTCDAKFKNISSYHKHMKWHELNSQGLTVPFHCTVCGARFTQSSNLDTHMQTHTGEKSFHCTVCGARFTNSSNLNTHMRIHTGEKPFHCTVCGARFTQLSSLNTHMRTHTGEKPFHCTVCEARFTQLSNLITHMRTHTGEKPFHCTVCGARFTNSSNLNTHMRTHTGEKPFHCTVCGARFTNSSNLNTHMRTHTGEKPFHCTVCGARFTQSSNLDTHMQTHTGEKSFHCTVCGARFTQLSNLNTHTRTHTGEKPFHCTVCGARFTNSSDLNKHKRTHQEE